LADKHNIKAARYRFKRHKNTKQYSSDCPSINPSRNEMKQII
jgi:hypothetical protein